MSVRRLLLCLGLFFVAAAPAPAQRLSVSASGSAAIAWAEDAGIKVVVGRPDSFFAPVVVPAPDRWAYPLWAVALPQGGARVAWVDLRVPHDQVQPAAAFVLRSAVVTADGAVQPAEDVMTYAAGRGDVPAIATNENGQMLVAWNDDVGAPHARLSSAGEPFADLPGPIPASPVPALSANGAVFLAGDHAGRILEPDGTFGPVFPLPLAATAASIADNGNAALLSHGNISLRKPDGDFGEPLRPSDPRASDDGTIQARLDGGASVDNGFGGFFDVSADGTITPAWISTRSVAFTQDGSALVSLYEAGSVRSRVGTGPLGDPVTVARIGVSPLVALSSGGQLIAWVRGRWLVTQRQSFPFAQYATDDADRRPYLLDGPIYMHGGVAEVRVGCQLYCSGTVKVHGGRGADVELALGFPRTIRLRAPRGSRRLRMHVSRFGVRRSVTRRVVRHRRTFKGCRIKGEATDLGTSTAGRILLTTVGYVAPGGRVEAGGVIACSRTRRRLLVPGVGPAAATRLAAYAVNGRFAAVATQEYPKPDFTVVRHDFRTGRQTVQRLSAPAVTEYDIRRIAVTSSGAVVVADSEHGRVRIRTADRVLDAGPGIDPGSLRATASGVSWLKDGIRQTAASVDA